MKKLFLIPARGGSKGLPRKNIIPLRGKPLIHYTLEAAKGAALPVDEICVSTDDTEIISVVEEYGIKVPFVRPAAYASDTATTQQVIKYSLEWYAERGLSFDIVVLLQPTSPLRDAQNVKEALGLWEADFEMIVSVKRTDANPYYVLREENLEGFLEPSKKGNFLRRQDLPDVWELNGAIYVINAEAVSQKEISDFQRIKKYVMSKSASVDIDDELDLLMAEKIMSNR